MRSVQGKAAEVEVIVAILTTRYRDIPWEEARKCQPTGIQDTDAAKWNRLRGKTIRVITPPDGKPSPHIVCNGPYYRVADLNAAVGDVVCPHIAEIVD
jgi:hypothetical protein